MITCFEDPYQGYCQFSIYIAGPTQSQIGVDITGACGTHTIPVDAGGDGIPYDFTPIKVRHEAGGQYAGVEGYTYLCIRNDVTTITLADKSNQFYVELDGDGDYDDVAGWNSDIEAEWFQIPSLEYIDFGNNNFDFGAGYRNALCEYAAAGGQFRMCEAHASKPNPTTHFCDCHDNFFIGGTGAPTCDASQAEPCLPSGMPCGGIGSNQDFYCESTWTFDAAAGIPVADGGITNSQWTGYPGGDGNAYCPITDICGTCEGDGTDCLDCSGVEGGFGKIDTCGNCVACEVGQLEDASVPGVPNVDGDVCPSNPNWNAECTGCIDQNACNTNQKIGGGNCFYNSTPFFPGLADDEWDSADDCSQAPPTGINQDSTCSNIPSDCNCISCQYDGGNCQYPINASQQGPFDGTCRCDDGQLDAYTVRGSDGNQVTYSPPHNTPESEEYCGCGYETLGDACGDCAADGQHAEINLNVPVLGETQEVTNIFEGSLFHPDGLFDLKDGSGAIYCDCVGTLRTTIQCYDANSDVLTETLLEWKACTSNQQTCESFNFGGHNFVEALEDGSAPPEAQDIGCRDATACNYNAGYDLDCDGTTGGNTDCCVYPAEYCRADGAFYPTAGSGEDWLCDLTEGNEIEFHETYCPMCDCEGDNIDCPPQCGVNNGYSLSVPFNPNLGLFQINNASGPPATDLISQGGFLLYAGAAGDPDVATMGDTCDVGCGTMNQNNPNNWILSGCPDPAAINYNTDGFPLWMSSEMLTSDQNNAIIPANEAVCQYCPSAANIADPTSVYNNLSTVCPAGYSFVWGNWATSITSQAHVSDYDMYSGNQSINNNFYLRTSDNPDDGVSSTVINGMPTQDFNSGYCFCDTDLNVLTDLAGTIEGYSVTDQNILNVHDYPLGWGYQVWDSFGRLTQLSFGGEQCYNSMNFEPGISTEADAAECRLLFSQLGSNGSTLPTSLGNATYLNHLDLSFQSFTGGIPRQSVEGLVNANFIDLSYNFFDDISQQEHYIENPGSNLQQDWGFCNLVAENGGPPTILNYWLSLRGNKICPKQESDQANTTSYPVCLAPKEGESEWWNLSNTQDEITGYSWQEWINQELGYITLPDFIDFNTDAQLLTDGLSSCTNIVGCKDATALNYWPEAGTACADCCVYDRFLHFPWGSSQPTGPPGGSFGGDMTVEQMVKALHANICGFQYNSYGDLDVGSFPATFGNDVSCAGYTEDLSTYGLLNDDFVNNCAITFQNDTAQGNGIIDWWDGLWIRSWSGYRGNTESGPFGTNHCGTGENFTEEFFGDARPLEFIQRVQHMATYWSSDYQGTISTYLNSFFPTYGQDISMDGLEYFEDFDITGDGNFGGGDLTEWAKLGRYDISYYIQDILVGNLPYPPRRPETVELWETAPVHVSMSYSQKFVSETDAGFTLYPEPNSPGVLRRSGQWVCDDGNSSDICYTNLDACGRAPSWLEECIPCGEGAGTCVPLTVDVAAEGHEKISKTKLIQFPYFVDEYDDQFPEGTGMSGSLMHTASLSSSNHPYYFNVTDAHPISSSADTMFSVAFGHYAGSGSDTQGGNIKGASEVIYRQYASLLLDDNNIEDGFLISSGSEVNPTGEDGDKDEFIYVLNFRRKKFEDQLQLGTWTLRLSGSLPGIDKEGKGTTLYLTDNSQVITSPEILTSAGRRYDIISGSNGVPFLNYQVNEGRYGFIYPDAGVMILGEKVAHQGLKSGSLGQGNTISPTSAASFGSLVGVDNQLYPYTGSDVDGQNALRLINCMKNVDGVSMNLTAEKEVTEVIYVCRLKGQDFNFTNNFTILSGSGRKPFSPDRGVMNSFNTAFTSSAFLSETQIGIGYETSTAVSGSEPIETTTELDDGSTFEWPGSNVTTMHGNPHTFVTGVQLYDEHGEMLATAQLSKPIKKAFDREVVIKVKLTY